MMRNTKQRATPWISAALVLTALGCSKEEVKEPAKKPAAAASAPAPLATAAPVASAAEPVATKPPVECPKGSTGEGSFDKPCEAKGAVRMMEVTWTGKTDDKGPSFRVVNKSPTPILHGKIAVYFYDKAGKQLEVQPASGSAAKPRPFHTCGGQMFGGVMKAGEKAVLTFSCVKKSHIPEGTTAIEAEMPTVGFADASEKQVDVYWRNADLAPDERRKGGIKK